MFKAFQYKPILTKEDIQSHQKKKRAKTSNMKGTISRIWQLVDEQRILLLVVLAMVFLSSVGMLLGPLLIGRMIDEQILPKNLIGIGPTLILLAGIYIMVSIPLFLQHY